MYSQNILEDHFAQGGQATFAGLMRDGAKLRPDKEMVFDGAMRISYSQAFDRACYLTERLAKFGIRKEDKVVICIPNWAEFPIIYCACQLLDMVVVPLIPSLRKKNFLAIMEQVRPSLVFLSCKEHREFIQQSTCDPFMIGVRFSDEGLFEYGSLITSETQEESTGNILPHDSTTIIYTSGSTGKPKGVVLKGSALLFTALYLNKALEANHDDVFLVPITFSHVFGLGPGLLMPLLVGARIVLFDRYKPEKILEIIFKERITVHFGVPTMFIRELKCKEQQEFDLSSLRTGLVAGSLCPSGLIKSFEQATGCKLICAYGLTETSSALTTTRLIDDEMIRFSTVGYPLDEVQITLVNTKEEPDYNRQIGEIVCKTPGITEGYYLEEDLTSESFDADGWFKTGDLGTIEVDGAVRIVGRRKNIINRGGFNIYPEEVEAYYRKYGKLGDTCLIDYPDTELGERTCLFVQLASDAYACSEELRTWAASGLEKFKIPDRIVFVQSMPRLGSGKVDRQRLRRMIAKLSGLTPCG
jgi:acyl-CoA synthetase (AMP-forming)/AMP-acid ligase II